MCSTHVADDILTRLYYRCIKTTKAGTLLRIVRGVNGPIYTSSIFYTLYYYYHVFANIRLISAIFFLFLRPARSAVFIFRKIYIILQTCIINKCTFFFFVFKQFFLRTGFLVRIVVFNDAAAHRRHNEVLKNTDARNTFEWEINLNGRKTRTYVYNMLLLHAIILLYLPSWRGGRKIFTGTADVSVSIQTCFFFFFFIPKLYYYR